MKLRFAGSLAAILLFSSLAHPQSSTDLYGEESRLVNAPGRVFGSVSLMETMGVTAAAGDTTALGGNVEYEFYRSYGVGADINYKRPYLQDDPSYNGWGDAVIYLTDRKLYADKVNRFDLSDRVNFIIPFSSRSLRSGLDSGVSGEIRALKGLGRWNIMVGTELGNYYYEYDTVDSTTQVIYNAPLVWGNRLVVTYNFNRAWHWNSAISDHMSYDYAAATHTMNMITTGVGWDCTETINVNAGLRTMSSDSPGFGSGADTAVDTPDPTQQGANSTPPNLFDAASTSFYMSLRVKL